MIQSNSMIISDILIVSLTFLPLILMVLSGLLIGMQEWVVGLSVGVVSVLVMGIFGPSWTLILAIYLTLSIVAWAIIKCVDNS